ncbi:MAG: hypothetical protein HYT75_05500 [Deltaproteobacteria bacterium]|nr:hypothetical protein [Deltaproteobacteria bacterium]
MVNKSDSCLNEKQSAIIDSFFGRLAGILPERPTYDDGDPSFSDLAENRSQVCLSDVERAIQGCFKNDSCWKPFAEKLKYLYYKENGRLKTDDSWWGISYERKWHSKDAVNILWEQIKGHANLTDAELARTGKLAAVRKEAKEFFLNDCSVGNLKNGDDPSDDKLCKLIVDAMSGKRRCSWTPEKAGYNLAYLDLNNKYKEKVLSYMFANPGALSGYQWRSVLSLYGMMTSADIRTLYKKYSNTPLQVWFEFTDLEGMGPLFIEMLKSNKFATTDKIKAYEPLGWAKPNIKTDEVCDAAVAIIESAEKKEDLVGFTLVKAIANCGQIQSAANAKEILKNAIADAVRQKDAKALDRLSLDNTWEKVPKEDLNTYQALADMITSICTPDEIAGLYDIEGARKFAERFLADSLAEAFLKKGGFVKLFEISPNIQGTPDFWKRFYDAVIKYKDEPKPEHILCLDVILRHAYREVLRGSDHEKNENDAMQMVSNHLKGSGPKFYHNIGYKVGWGIYDIQELGDERVKEAIKKTKQKDGDGVIMLRSLLERYAYLARSFNYFYDNATEEEKEHFIGLMNGYLTTGLPALLVFNMEDTTRRSLVESSAVIFDGLSRCGGVAGGAGAIYRSNLAHLAMPLCLGFPSTRQCYSEKGLDLMYKLYWGEENTSGLWK